MPYPRPTDWKIGLHPQTSAGRERERPSESLSDEGIKKAMDKRGLPYRHGYPQLPPFPITTITKNARQHVPEALNIYNEVNKICLEYGIEPKHTFFAFRVPKVRSANRYHTLVIATHLKEDQSVTEPIILIRKHLLRYNTLHSTAIEIIDLRALHGLHSFAIHPSEKHLLDIWRDAYRIALEEIQKQRQRWLTIEMSHRGLHEDVSECPATITITSPSAGDDIWFMNILPAIQERLSVYSLGLCVEVLCGLSIYCNGTTSKADMQMYGNRVRMGSSIGQQQLTDQSGTVGGMVKLSNGTSYALSNHHVVNNEALEKLLGNKAGNRANNVPLQPGHRGFQAGNHRLTSPSNEDHLHLLEDLDKAEVLFKSQSLRCQDDNEENLRELQVVRENIALVKQSERHFATLYASSGLRTVAQRGRISNNPQNGEFVLRTGKNVPKFNFVLDWSLSSFGPHRKVVNMLRTKSQEGSTSSSTLASGKVCDKWTVLNNPKHSILSDDVSVGKCGRTTAFTYGTIDLAPVIINPTEKGGEFMHVAMPYNLTTDDCGHCESVIRHERLMNFNESGDSGSIVLHAPSGDWLGLLFGSTGTGRGLFTPIELVFRDIEKVTGLKVVEPVFNPN